MVVYIAEIIKLGAQFQIEDQAIPQTAKIIKDISGLQEEVINEMSHLKPTRPESRKPLAGQSIMILWLETMLAAKNEEPRLEGIRDIVTEAAACRGVQRNPPLQFDKQGKYYPGLPTCIMALENPVVISATKDRYGTAGLDGKSLRRRDGYLRGLEEDCSERGKEAIKKLRNVSVKICEESNRKGGG
ncbi:hypothetical protein GQX73_g710 [Xylaria multiplex]|uniref:Uncharacterized protein n=1 Tax=Xylaria multiplex TaxID=323545 RepID=A0A7C8IXR8_9PEZI|nr:hypothetical protein GQX73_g710 [Xylaria multiplex]